ncbi:MAG: DUF2207 domain-containing protein [Planctomycetota bacterium]|jgi:uncharacterized membrane protein YgcG
MRKWLVLPLLALAAMAAPARAETERIIDFHSDITVKQDGSLLVKETIKVYAHGNRIKRGIYRDFPTLYRGPWFTRKTVPFDVHTVRRDGKPEAHHMETMQNGKRVYCGRKDVLLKPGEYTYTLVYTTDRQLGYFEDHDELYWNVTGTGWEFSIGHASATVTLPRSVPREQVQLDGYTGPQDAKGVSFASEMEPDGKAEFSTLRSLAPYEGLTIVVSWPKGHVREPSEADKRAYFLQNNFGLIVGAIGTLGILAYYLGVWIGVGRDPAKGLIFPRYEPPEGFTPAAVRYLRRMGYDGKCLTTAVINLAVKGLLTVEEASGEYTLTKAARQARGLPSDERKVWTSLLGRRQSIALEQKNHKRIGKAIKKQKEALALGLHKRYFFTNRKFLIPAIVLSGIVFLAAGVLHSSPDAPTGVFLMMCVWVGGWTAGVGALLAVAVGRWRATFAGGPQVLSNLAGALVISLLSVPFLLGEVMGLAFLSMASSIWTVAMLFVLVVLALLFHYLLKAPTRAGREVLDQIDGFRMYLRAAEEHRLDVLHPPEKTPELFEKYLPYALALDCENEWAEQFAEVLSRAAEGRPEYSPGWYSGPSWTTLGATGLASSIGSSFSGAIAAASTAPGSVSGGGGGGGSGGGGGGGGGGGW